MNQPELLIVGGANGSGKTTFAREIVRVKNISYLGADEIAAELNSGAPEKAAIEAARVFSRRLAESIEKGESLIANQRFPAYR